jgi:hypothetical protein
MCNDGASMALNVDELGPDDWEGKGGVPGTAELVAL